VRETGTGAHPPTGHVSSDAQALSHSPGPCPVGPVPSPSSRPPSPAVGLARFLSARSATAREWSSTGRGRGPIPHDLPPGFARRRDLAGPHPSLVQDGSSSSRSGPRPTEDRRVGRALPAPAVTPPLSSGASRSKCTRWPEKSPPPVAAQIQRISATRSRSLRPLRSIDALKPKTCAIGENEAGRGIASPPARRLVRRCDGPGPIPGRPELGVSRRWRRRRTGTWPGCWCRAW
jgi:hypothetical protein